MDESDDRMLEALPRWAVVAFAARCAHRALPVFLEAGGAPERHKLAVQQAADLAADAARTPVTNSAAARDVSAAASTAGTDANAAADEASEIAGCRPAAFAAAYAAYTTGCAADVELAAAGAGGGAVANAKAAANGAASAVRAVCGPGATPDYSASAADLSSLTRLAQEQRWNDDSPVDPDMLGPLWPDSEPDWTLEGRD